MPSTADSGWNGERKPSLPTMSSSGTRPKSKKMVSTAIGFEVMRWKRKFSKGLIEFKMTANPKGGNATAALLPNGCNFRSDWAVSKLNEESCASSSHFRDVGTTMCAHICHDEKKICWYSGSDIKDSRLVCSQPIRLDMLPVIPVFSTFGSNVRVEITDISERLFQKDPEIIRMDETLCREADQFRAKLLKETPTTSPALSCSENPAQTELIAELESLRDTLTTEKEALSETTNTLESEKQQLESELEVKTNRIASLDNQLKAMRAANASLEEQLQNREDHRKESHDKANDQEMEIRKLSKKVKSLEANLEKEQQQASDYRQSEANLKQQLSQLQINSTPKEEIDKLTKELSDLQLNVIRLESELSVTAENFDREKATKNELLREKGQQELLIADLKGQVLMLGKLRKTGERSVLGTPRTPRQESLHGSTTFNDDNIAQLRQQLEEVNRVKGQQEFQIADLKGQVSMMTKMKGIKVSQSSPCTSSFSTPTTTPRDYALGSDITLESALQQIADLKKQLLTAQRSDASQQEISELRNQLRVALLTDDDDVNAKMAILQNTIKTLEETAQLSPHHITSLEQKISSLEKENNSLKQANGSGPPADDQQKEIEFLQSQITELKDQLRVAILADDDNENETIAALSKKNQSLEDELLHKDDQISSLRQSSSKHDDTVTSLNTKIHTLEEELTAIRTTATNDVSLADKIAALEDDLTEKNQENEHLKSENVQKQQQLSDMTDVVSDLKSQNEKLSLQTDIESEQKTAMDALKKENEQKEQQLTDVMTSITELKAQNDKLTAQLNADCENCLIHETEKRHLECEIEAIRASQGTPVISTTNYDADLQKENDELKAQLRIALLVEDDDHNAAMDLLHKRIECLEERLAETRTRPVTPPTATNLHNESAQLSQQLELRSNNTVDEDVVSELQSTVKRLEGDLQAALLSEDADNEINELKEHIKTLEKDYSDTQERLQRVLTDDDEVDELSERIAVLESENLALRSRHSECDSLSLSTTHRDDPSKLHLVHELSSAKELYEIKDAELQTTKQQHAELIALRESETAQFTELARSMQSQVEVLKEQLAAKKEAPESLLLEQLTTLDSQKEDLASEVTNLKNKLMFSEEKSAAEEIELTSLKDEIESLKTELTSQKSEHETKQNKLTTELETLRKVHEQQFEAEEEVSMLRDEVTELRSEMALLVSDHAEKSEKERQARQAGERSHKKAKEELTEKISQLSEQLQTVKSENRTKIDKLTAALEKANARSQCLHLATDITSPGKDAEGCEPRQTFQKKWLTGLRLSNTSEFSADEETLSRPEHTPPGYPQGRDSYTYEELRLPSSLGQFTIDVNKRESYLSDEEFKKIFSIPKLTFYMLPSWKQVRMKRRLCLI